MQLTPAAQELGLDAGDDRKIGEIPYDFIRKRLSVITADGKGDYSLVTKGALDELLEVCSQYQKQGKAEALDQAQRAAIEKEYSDWSERGFRVLGVASRTVSQKAGSYSTAEERDLTFAGFLLFFDPPKKDVRQVIADLEKRGVELKIITGDNQKIARHVAEAVQLPEVAILTGHQIGSMRDDALLHAVEHTNIFAEVDPTRRNG